MNIFQPVNSEEKEFYRHILDLIHIGEKTQRPRFSSFLTEREQQLARLAVQSAGFDFGFWGGYESAVRKMFSSPHSDENDYPLESVTFIFRSQDKLTHRDFLGALMSLGVQRDQIGDIAVSDGGAVVFASKNISSLILSEIDKIGRVGVRAESGIKIEIPEQRFEEISAVAASRRIDAIVAAACAINREKAAMMVKSGSITVNGVEICSPSKNLELSDIFSVKGYGKFIFSQLGNETKKGKYHIVINKYK
ncbi:MAG: YlmH/Sll1252 family protein [Firmicutes bacterium]|nr:YlmH/Sll1252 family protein [[Eubacterium] siraeum]MCM1486910.1 YlmH/Sll1252 family protein [Bacillota bacterium]